MYSSVGRPEVDPDDADRLSIEMDKANSEVETTLRPYLEAPLLASSCSHPSWGLDQACKSFSQRVAPSSSNGFANEMITSLHLLIRSSAAFALAAAKPTHSKAICSLVAGSVPRT